MRVGFLGLGRMGTPMAINLAKVYPTTVWNRSASKYPAVIQAGAAVADSAPRVVESSDVIFTMLFDAPAIESIFDSSFQKALKGKTIVNTSSVSTEYSSSLAERISAAGGSFVEMPVSGSKVPAEQGSLVGMMAGDEEVCKRIQHVVEPITSAAIYCGPIGSGLRMKYAINTYLITMTAGLAESVNLAKAQGLDLEAYSKVLQAGPLASAYSTLKMGKILAGDWSAQAAIKDCFNSTELIRAAARATGTQAPLIDVCNGLYGRARSDGLEEEDMIAVFKVLSKLQDK